MSSSLQGAPLPDVTSATTKTTTAPSWYSDYLSGLASKGQSALAAAGVAGPSPLQNMAYSNAPSAVQAGQPGTIRAGQELASVSEAYTPDMVQGFMSPYTSDVVDEIGRLGVQNFNEILAPGATAGAVGSGQFGSRRGMEVYGNTARNAASNMLGQQSVALQSGYQKAMEAAQAEKRIGLDTARGFADLGQTAYNQSTGGIDVLQKLGAQQQATEQARYNHPMAAVKDYASLFSGQSIPTSTSQTTVGPGQAGQYQKSPLELGLMYGLGAGGIFASGPNGAPSIASNLTDLVAKYGEPAYDWINDMINDYLLG